MSNSLLRDIHIVYECRKCGQHRMDTAERVGMIAHTFGHPYCDECAAEQMSGARHPKYEDLIGPYNRTTPPWCRNEPEMEPGSWVKMVAGVTAVIVAAVAVAALLNMARLLI